MRTIEGTLKHLGRAKQVSRSFGDKYYVQKFKIDNVQIELISQSAIEINEGDYVLVAGLEFDSHLFKAYALKKLN